jgi:hypothetical protein
VLLCEKGEYAWNTFNEQFAKFIGDAEMHSPRHNILYLGGE